LCVIRRFRNRFDNTGCRFRLLLLRRSSIGIGIGRFS
jgi:hypothetical protein